METSEAVTLLQIPAVRQVVQALLEMSRTQAWGHVTVRFQEGEIRQVDTLVTVRCGEQDERRSDRAA